MGRRAWRGLMLAALLIFISIPVQADGDGIGIEVSQLPAFLDIDANPELQVYVQGFGVNATAELQASISDAEGQLVWSWGQNVSLGGADTAVLVLNLSTVPAGQQQLDLALIGHVLVSNSTHVSSASVSVQRDRPLSIGIVTASSDRVEGLSVGGEPNGEDPIDADRLAWFLTVRNFGDVPWNGTLAANFSQGTMQETVERSVNLSGMNTSELVLSTTSSWEEGLVEVQALLMGLNDADMSDNALHLNVSVGPPLLPSLVLTLQRQNTPEVPGAAWGHILSLSNVGLASWSGQVNCTWEDGSLHASVALTANVSETVEAFVQGPAKDGVLTCTADGPRVAGDSQGTAEDTLAMSTAQFEVVAGGEPVPLDGPWDVGDQVRWSAVVRNIGSSDGTVALEVGDGQDVHASESIELGPGEASELSLSHTLTRSGDVVWAWSLVSNDGSLMTPGGNSTLLIQASPTLSAAIDAVRLDADHGHVVEWNLSVASSVSREVTLDVGHGVPGAWTWASSSTLLLDGNALTGETHLGWIDAENVAVRVSPVAWTHDGGPLLVASQIQPARVDLELTLRPTTVPVDPVAGDSTTLVVDISNTGTAPSNPVTVRLVSSGEVLATANIDAIAPGEVETESMAVSWPEGSLVGIEAVLVHDEERAVSQVSFQVVVPEVESSLTVPWAGLALGIAGGLVLLGVETIRRRASSTSTPDRSSSSKVEPKSSSKAPVPSAEKIEVACPACDRKLRVPSDYTGAVRCPDCRERFDVEAPQPAEPQPTEQDAVEVLETPAKIEIGCPACSRALRVPADFNGRVRCPACKHEFSREEAK